MKEDFAKAMDFILEVDGLKNIFRRTLITKEERFENDAEHSWHVALMAQTLIGFFDEEFTGRYGKIDPGRAVKMLLLHDIVELYAGDTYCYDSAAAAGKYERELEAAEKVFSILPSELKEDFMGLWLEFDREESADAIFASIMDKIQPLLLNYKNNGTPWSINKVTKSMVEKRMSIALQKGPTVLREYVQDIIDKAAEKGYLING